MNKKWFNTTLILSVVMMLILSACQPNGQSAPAIDPAVGTAVAQTLQAMPANDLPGCTNDVAEILKIGNELDPADREAWLETCGNPPTQPAGSNPTAALPANTLAASANSNSGTTGECAFAQPGNLDNMPKTLIELFQQDEWSHRVFNTRLFNEANQWGGADSWFATLAVGPNSGGSWTSYGNPGEIIYRANQTTSSWCLGILTTSTWKSQFMGDTSLPAAINVKVKEEWPVTVRTASGKVITQNTSDGGDITIILPDDGVVYVWVTVTTNSPTFESRIHWGPYDRSEGINTVHGEE